MIGIEIKEDKKEGGETMDDRYEQSKRMRWPKNMQ
jgi:hypothetical protein